MTKVLADFVTASRRFTRSANVERDHGGAAIEGYVPTGRAIDVIARIANGLTDASAGRTFSITGPHGSGKSSLAVFLDALLAGSVTAEHKAAHQILAAVDPLVDTQLKRGVNSLKAGKSGFIRAFATARNEPVTATIARALHRGASSYLGAEQDVVPNSFSSSKRVPTTTDIRESVARLAGIRPVLLIIDEFGKNLEYFSSSDTDGDPFLLQELAEATQGESALPLVIITMQHLSFEEYVQGSATSRRREWAKVQGRFQDIPYVETPAQARRLIASALEQDSVISSVAIAWVNQHRDRLESQGLRDIVEDAAAAVPLHPMALAVLPELCSRYGQNERTLFSFLAGSEPSAFPQFLASTSWEPSQPIPLAGLDLLYDYFLESSGSMIGVADGASRWIEIETRIRDTAGLSSAQLRALKTIGVLNLVATGGRIRASRQMLELCLDSAQVVSGDDFDGVLTSLVDAGLITYRAFSDEYRIWQGSDYDLRRVIENARSMYESVGLEALLREAVHLEPVVAGRHSQRNGVLRVFGRTFTDGCPDEHGVDRWDPTWDGIVYYTTDPTLDENSIAPAVDGRPAIYVVPADVSDVRDAAIDAAALRSALHSAEQEGADWVAVRELVERSSAAEQRLHVAIGGTWDARADWFRAGAGDMLAAELGLSAVLSDVADSAYRQTPRIANEMIARRELTSQGAKARRFLTDAMLAHPDREAFGIEGYGPERAIYEAIFRKTGIHRTDGEGRWALHAPTDRSWRSAWALMNSAFDDAVDARVSLSDVAAMLMRPPVGLKAGIVPLVLTAGLVVRADEVAVYEHGSLVLAIDDAVAERLAKNIGHFSVKNTQTRGEKRAAVIGELVVRLGISSHARTAAPTFLNVATALFRELRLLPPYTQKTRRDLSASAIAVRDAFRQATEPDVLLFEELPSIFGISPFVGRGRGSTAAAEDYAEQLADTMRELRDCYPALLRSIQRQLAQATSTADDATALQNALHADATRLDGQVLEPRLKAFVGALARPLDYQTWLENVAMVVCDGQAPRTWTDDIAGRFALRALELGGALRRTSALLHDRLAANTGQSYSVSRMTLTRPDGTESIELLALTEPERSQIDVHFDRIIDALTSDGSLTRAAACRMLMARLAVEHETAVDADEVSPIARKDRRHG